MPEYAEHGLRRWSHALGYRGHFLTKSLAYSTTFGALRGARADHQPAPARERSGIASDVPAQVVKEWSYAGREHTPIGLAGDARPPD
jgi:hypothetical protein